MLLNALKIYQKNKAKHAQQGLHGKIISLWSETVTMIYLNFLAITPIERFASDSTRIRATEPNYHQVRTLVLNHPSKSVHAITSSVLQVLFLFLFLHCTPSIGRGELDSLLSKSDHLAKILVMSVTCLNYV